MPMSTPAPPRLLTSNASPPRRGPRKQRRRRKGPYGIQSNNSSSSSSTSSSSSESVEKNKQLEQLVEEFGYNGIEHQHRRSALDHLEKIVARWTTTLRQIENSGNAWGRPRVALISFGSYRLGVDRPTSDLDVLALSPPNCTRGDFFTSLVALLKEDPKISQVHPIPQAYTPVIKFVLDDLLVDLVFARVANPRKLLVHQQKRVSPLVQASTSPSITPAPRIEYMIDDSDLAELDEASVRSLNGARVSQILLQMVPNLKRYQLVLRAVKEWAVRVGIYSNVLGFLGGVNGAILVAWVCIRHPQSDPASLLEAFFSTFAYWDWPRPVALTPIQDAPPKGALMLPAWNAHTNPRDRIHVMPIITPAYPSMNSSYNVGGPQLRRINEEMKKGYHNMRKGDIRALFAPSNFFSQHKHFLQINIRASNRQDFVEWFRLVESRLRLLICNLDTPQVHSWPYGKFFECRYNSNGVYQGQGRSEENCMHESYFFIALKFAPNVDTVNLRHLTSDFLHKVTSWAGRKGGMDLSLVHVTGDSIPPFVFQEEDGGELVDDEDSDNKADGPAARVIMMDMDPLLSPRKYRMTEQAV